MLNMSSLLKTNRMDRIFHVYDKKTKECVYNCLTVEQLEDKIKEGNIDFSSHDIETVRKENLSDASY